MNTSNQSALEVGATKSLDQIRKEGLDKEMLERIAADVGELKRVKEEQKARLPGNFLTLREDKETRVFYFTGEYQKIQLPAKDFVTKQEIPGKTITKFKMQVYDVTDPNNPSEVSIWERGVREAEQVLYWMLKGEMTLTVMRNGEKGSQNTFYNIYPAK